MDLGIEGRTAVILGGTAGIGAAVSETLAAEGTNVVLVGRDDLRTREQAAKVRHSVGVVSDLTDVGSAERIVDATMKSFGTMDILVLNGGGPPPGTAIGMTTADLDDAFTLLVRTHIALVRLALPQMLKQKWGRIIGIGSSGIQQPLPNLAMSNVGRAALAAYLKTLAGEVAGQGVTVNMALPGRIETGRLLELDGMAARRNGVGIEDIRSDSWRNIPAGRYGKPEEFAALVAFLASDMAGYITGVEVRCDGGLVRGR